MRLFSHFLIRNIKEIFFESCVRSIIIFDTFQLTIQYERI